MLSQEHPLVVNFHNCHFPQLSSDKFYQGHIDPKAGRGHGTPHMPVETAKCWWLLKIEPNAWVGGKGSCAVCIDLQAVGALEFFGELYHGCCMLTNQIAQLEVGNFHKHLPRGGYFLPVGLFKLQGVF